MPAGGGDPRPAAHLGRIRVLLSLALHANTDGECFPSRTRLSELTGIHETTISKTTTLLARRGWLRKERGHAGRSNRYSDDF